MAKKQDEILDIANAEVMAELIADPATTELLRVRIISKILESREGQSFFRTMFEDGLSFGECPGCGHQNHWAIPEVSLNQMGWVTSELDKEVSTTTTADVCETYQEACAKKKLTV
jgi:hypothetical protein